MNSPRYYHDATLLPNGNVLVSGGSDGNNTVATSEVYNTATSAWSLTGSMHTPRQDYTMILLPGGQVLVAGGLDNFERPLSSAELYTP